MIYEQQDYDKAVIVISKGFLKDTNMRKLELTQPDIDSLASAYHHIRTTHTTELAWNK